MLAIQFVTNQNLKKEKFANKSVFLTSFVCISERFHRINVVRMRVKHVVQLKEQAHSHSEKMIFRSFMATKVHFPEL
jgi:hypothetical protein